MNIILKIIGVLMVVFSTSAYGLILSRDLHSRLNELKEIKKIMFLLKGEIAFGLTPVFEACDNTARRSNGVFKDILLDFAGHETEVKTSSIDEIWKRSFEKGLSKSHLNGNEKDRIILLGSSLGLADSKTQENAITAYLNELEVSIEQLEKSTPSKTRLYNSMGIMCGIVLTIIIV